MLIDLILRHFNHFSDFHEESRMGQKNLTGGQFQPFVLPFLKLSDEMTICNISSLQETQACLYHRVSRKKEFHLGMLNKKKIEFSTKWGDPK